MSSKPDSGSNGADHGDNLTFYLKELSTGVRELRLELAQAKERIGDLEDRLDVERRGSKSRKEEFDQHSIQWEKEKRELEGQVATLKDSERRVVCLIDGDGTLFSREYLSKGHEGGQDAAQTLAQNIRVYLRDEDAVSFSNFELSIICFLHKRGLTETLGRAGYHTEKSRFDEFLAGFNQAGERFLMVDVGAGKENADAKLRAFLTDHARSPYTRKIFIGVSHDNGYVPILKDVITGGQKDKLVLLPGYSEIAADIRKLQLPTLVVPGLFILEKLPPTSPRLTNSKALDPSPRSLPTVSVPGSPALPSQGLSPLSPPFAFNNFASITPSGTPSHAGASSSGAISISTQVALPGVSRQPREPPPNIPLKSLIPPPCHAHYLSRSCHHRNFAKLAKGLPCKFLNENKPCLKGNQCIWGHICPYGARCFLKKKGKCKFIAAGMHKM
ncbi:unnamed protein product [Somion occarium]|uniref:DUF7923 domain-containing protein n=1 Tax=Somion occarium TaxID=3059160 RepID=A0ABP1D1H2_9APHY